jgi:hypothetical protein
MKNKISLIILLFCTSHVFSQGGTNSIAMGNEFAMLAAHGGTGANFSTFQSYSSNQVNGSQFFLPDWSAGEIALNSKEVFMNGILLAYDKVRQELFIRQQGATDILLGTKEDINTFSLKDAGKEYHFVNSSVYSKVKPEVFYQVLVSDPSKLTLLKYTKGTFVKADKNDMMKEKEGDIYDSFVDKVTYYISKENGELEQLQLKTKALKKTFTDLNINIDNYINKHPESIDEDYLISLVMELNR